MRTDPIILGTAFGYLALLFVVAAWGIVALNRVAR